MEENDQDTNDSPRQEQDAHESPAEKAGESTTSDQADGATQEPKAEEEEKTGAPV